MSNRLEQRRRLEHAITRLIRDKPFYGHLITQFNRRLEEGLPAGMGVRLDRFGMVQLVYNPHWMVVPVGSDRFTPGCRTRPWTDEETPAVVEHECRHIVHDHLLRAKHRDNRLWNLATDAALNQDLAGMPPACIYPSTLGLEPGGTADEYYEAIKDEPECPVCGGPPDGSGQEPGSSDGRGAAQQTGDSGDADGTDESGKKSAGSAGDPADEDGRQGSDVEAGPSGANPGQDDPGDEGADSQSGTSTPNDAHACPGCGSGGIDDHSAWQEEPDAAEDVVRERMRQYMRKAYRLAGGKKRMQGYMPSDLVREIEEAIKEPYDWRPLLRRFCHGVLKAGRRTTKKRPNRRFGRAFPGHCRRRRGRVAVLVDTSCSIRADELAQFWAELKAITSLVEVVVAECDAQMQDVYELTKTSALPAFKGGGGTVFTSVFEAMAGRGRHHERQWLLVEAEALIVLTDGHARVPASNITRRPVMWALIPGGQRPVEYGDEIRIGESG